MLILLRWKYFCIRSEIFHTGFLSKIIYCCSVLCKTKYYPGKILQYSLLYLLSGSFWLCNQKQNKVCRHQHKKTTALYSRCYQFESPLFYNLLEQVKEGIVHCYTQMRFSSFHQTKNMRHNQSIPK